MLIPLSIGFFLTIFIVKVLCFLISDASSKRRNHSHMSFNEEKDSDKEDKGIEMLIGVYLDVMAKVQYKKLSDETSPEFEEFKYMSFQ